MLLLSSLQALLMVWSFAVEDDGCLLTKHIGSKHWPTDSQAKLWKWFTPHIKTIFKQKSNDTLPVWASFFEACLSMRRAPA